MPKVDKPEFGVGGAALGILGMFWMFGPGFKRERFRQEWWASLHPAERGARSILGQLFAAINRGAAHVTRWLLEPPDETTPEHLQSKPRPYKVGVDEGSDR